MVSRKKVAAPAAASIKTADGAPAQMTWDQVRAQVMEGAAARARQDQEQLGRFYALVDRCSAAETDYVPEAAHWVAAERPSVEVLMSVLDAIDRLGQSRSQSIRAGKKNAEPREWVREQWTTNRGDFSKAAFARIMVDRIKAKFPNANTVTARQIETKWLKGL